MEYNKEVAERLFVMHNSIWGHLRKPRYEFDFYDDKPLRKSTKELEMNKVDKYRELMKEWRETNSCTVEAQINKKLKDLYQTMTNSEKDEVEFC